MLNWAIGILLLIPALILGCSRNQVDTEVYDDPAVLEGLIMPLTEDRILTEIRDNPSILIHFTSYDPNCSYCVDSNVFVDGLARELAGSLRIGRITWNPWTSFGNSADLPRLLQFNGLPLMILFKDGKIAWRHDGYSGADSPKVCAELRKHL